MSNRDVYQNWVEDSITAINSGKIPELAPATISIEAFIEPGPARNGYLNLQVKIDGQMVRSIICDVEYALAALATIKTDSNKS